MKLLLSAYACEPNRGTELGNGWNWALNTAKLGHEVWCLTTVEGRENIEKEVDRLALPNLHIVFVELPKLIDKLFEYHLGFYPHYLCWQQQAYRKARELDKEIDFDLVHHVTIGSLQLGTALWRLNKPLIFGPAGGGQEAPRAFKKYFYGWWKTEVVRSWISKLLLKVNPDVRKTMRHASLVLATNEDTYNMARANGALNPQMFLDTSLPESFYPEAYPERKPSDVMKILWVGRLFARKGLPLVLESLGKVDPAVKYELTILGDGQMRDMVPQWIKEHNLEGKVNWKGQVPWDEVKRAYTESDLFMFCSLRDSSAAQFLESMAYGLPILTLDLHGGKNLVPDNAGIKISVTTPEKTVQQLANAVEQLYHDPKLRSQMGKNGYEFSKSQTWPVKTKHINEFYGKYTLADTKELPVIH
ncbi:glycosyltransferase involved in cell wall biosynthesis [Pontibacter aydingkolensis]|uniref:Glycosyltransferase family 4 protein n=1 Tax=Pontibacter aydingkolensis TaxID=1911536 RepID=A0ABS7CTA8_9BACT|nr:glycosyltransferase family 4 protein [Pontibacter aydingkolensis]MBW7466722.1 glycosyltransferase family 4 protein [Pontibacter aydingkolensis]